MSRFSVALETRWYQSTLSPWLMTLLPLSAIFFLLSKLNKHTSLKKRCTNPVPVWVVGNISIGGTGKTPVTCALVKYCQEKNIQVGIVSRGYGGVKSGPLPYSLSEQSTARDAGDEPMLMYKRLACPVVICANRNAAVETLVTSNPEIQLIISDDGLQHYALDRQLEIAVVDAKRGLGNGWLLPAGPLRESALRLNHVDMIINNGELTEQSQQDLSAYSAKSYEMTLQPSALLPVFESTSHGSVPKPKQTVHAVAGIGHPQRFFNSLKDLGFDVIEHRFPDHYQYQFNDLCFNDKLPVIMTEKDAVKCANLEQSGRTNDCYFLPVDAQFPPEFYTKLNVFIESL